MLTAAQNEELTAVEAGTRMGEVLRRYWYPVAFTAELEEFPVKRVELLGEFFALWRSPSGRYGIMPEACPHRKASMAYGVVEADGLRCPYHGWVFDHEGTCTEQPAERDDTNFAARVKARAGVAQELGGLVWAYVGPHCAEQPAPELPRFDTYVMEGFRDIGWADLPCNYVQIMENAVDPHHVEFLHGRYFEFVGRHEGFTAPPSFGKKHVKVGFDAFEWGIIKRRVVEGASEENDDWKIGHPLVFPYNMRVGGGGVHQMQIRVPINRTTTRFMLYTVHRPDQGYEHVEQPAIPTYELPLTDHRGVHVTNYVEGQDMMAWVTQGPITDRTTEHLGRSDVGIALLRRMFREQMDAVEAGRDPLGTVRTPHERIDLPCEKDKFHAGAEFALAFCDMGSTRYSPMLDTIRKIHMAAAERAGVGT